MFLLSIDQRGSLKLDKKEPAKPAEKSVPIEVKVIEKSKEEEDDTEYLEMKIVTEEIEEIETE